MLTTDEILALEEAGADLKMVRIFNEILEKRYQALRNGGNEKGNAKSNAEKQRDYRNRKKNNNISKEENKSVTEALRNGGNTAAHIENARTCVEDNLLLKNTIKESKKESKRENKSNGNRLTVTQLPDTWHKFCEEENPNLDSEEIFEDFRDYWISQPGQKGLKLDWFATWRRWVRKQDNNYATKGLKQQYVKSATAGLY